MFIGFSMWVTLMFLSSWVPASIKRKAVGLGLLTDIAIHVALQFMFGGTGEERIGVLLGGIFFNMTMHLYRKLFGYEVLTWEGWDFRPGKFRSTIQAR